MRFNLEWQLKNIRRIYGDCCGKFAAFTASRFKPATPDVVGGGAVGRLASYRIRDNELYLQDSRKLKRLLLTGLFRFAEIGIDSKGGNQSFNVLSFDVLSIGMLEIEVVLYWSP